MEIYGLTDSLPDVSIAILAPSDKERNPLGWHYQSGQGKFFGLIPDNLTRKVRAH